MLVFLGASIGTIGIIVLFVTYSLHAKFFKFERDGIFNHFWPISAYWQIYMALKCGKLPHEQKKIALKMLISGIISISIIIIGLIIQVSGMLGKAGKFN